jgi:hypothetical protein
MGQHSANRADWLHWGHEERFPQARLSAGYRFRKQTMSERAATAGSADSGHPREPD